MEIDVKWGHPNDPNRGQLLTEDDEKRMDAEGRPIVDGLSWSEAATGLYLFVGVADGPLTFGARVSGASAERIPGTSKWMSVGVLNGKASADKHWAGASLEIPSDLGRDHLKQKYVAEWVADTAAEALALTGCSKAVAMGETDAGIHTRMSSVGIWVGGAAQKAIESTGL